METCGGEKREHIMSMKGYTPGTQCGGRRLDLWTRPPVLKLPPPLPPPPLVVILWSRARVAAGALQLWRTLHDEAQCRGRARAWTGGRIAAEMERLKSPSWENGADRGAWGLRGWKRGNCLRKGEGMKGNYYYAEEESFILTNQVWTLHIHFKDYSDLKAEYYCHCCIMQMWEEHVLTSFKKIKDVFFYLCALMCA